MKKSFTKINIFLISLLFVFILITYSGYNHESENIFEYLQNLVLITAIIVQYKYKDILIRFSSSFFYFIRLFFLLFFLYEEFSFLTENINFYEFNTQGEFNIHNVKFLDKFGLLKIKLPFTNFSFGIIWESIIYSLISVVFGFGGYIKLNKAFSFIFLEKELGFYGLFFPLLLVTRSIFENLLGFCQLYCIMESEFLEMYIYIILLLDTFLKVKLANKNH